MSILKMSIYDYSLKKTVNDDYKHLSIFYGKYEHIFMMLT